MHRELSFALSTHFTRTTQLVLDVTPVIAQPLPLRETPLNALGYTRATAQLQVAL